MSAGLGTRLSMTQTRSPKQIDREQIQQPEAAQGLQALGHPRLEVGALCPRRPPQLLQDLGSPHSRRGRAGLLFLA